MSTCATCKLWAKPSWETEGFGTCYLQSELRDSKPPRPVVLKVCVSGMSVAWLATHESFGCNQHQPKPEEKP